MPLVSRSLFTGCNSRYVTPTLFTEVCSQRRPYGQGSHSTKLQHTNDVFQLVMISYLYYVITSNKRHIPLRIIDLVE